MNSNDTWDPRSPAALANPLETYDNMRRKCPVAHSEYLNYSVFGHAEVMRIVNDHATFSSKASSHVSVPNSMDPPQHTAWRQLIDPYFSAARVQAFEPVCQQISKGLVQALPRNQSVELMFALAHPFSLRIQCAFLGWPASLHEPLRQWIIKKNLATLAADRHAIQAVATEFDATIRKLLQQRRAAGTQAPDDVTTSLLHASIAGRAITEQEIVSILRNWTVGELGTIASSVGIIANFLATHPDIQNNLRQNPEQIYAANDEILRIHAPLIANRRCPRQPVEIGGVKIPAGERITIMWAAANRDEKVFANPTQFSLEREPELNLLYGAGIHACPGAALARLELKTIIQALLADTHSIRPIADDPPSVAIYPASGYSELKLQLGHVDGAVAHYYKPKTP